MSIRILAPRERVFEHLLMPHHLARWWCSFAQVSPKAGGAFNFGGDYCIVPPEGLAHKCTFTGGEVRRSVTFTWPLHSGDTVAKWEVEDAGTSSNFRVTHQGLTQSEGPCGKLRDAYRVCLGNLKAICESRGDSLRPDYAPFAHPEVRLVVLIDVPPEKVFVALDSLSTLREWAARRIPFGNGGRLEGPPEGDPVAPEILAREPGKRLTTAWPGMGEMTWNLEAKASGTGVYFRHADPPGNDQALRNLRGWWSSLHVDLKNLLEAGEDGFLEGYDGQQTQT